MTSSFKKRPRISARGALLLACAAAFAASCSDDPKPRGQLMLAITTDLSIAKDMNQVGVQVYDADGNIVAGQDLDILPVGDLALPGTLAVVPPNSGGQTVRIVVTAKKTTNDSSNARVVREAIVKVPTDRVALLRMPLHWLCDAKTDCVEGETCKAGVCTSATTDSNELPDYSPPLVFGGGDANGLGSYCLDAQGCFAHTAVLKPNKADCTVPLPKNADPASLNVALVLPPETDGHCLDGEDGTCYMPLDNDPEEGFAIVGDKIQMPAAACKRASVVGVSISTACRTKDLSVPICGPWTGWPAQPGPDMDAGSAGAGGSPDISSGGSAGKGTATGGVGNGEGGEGGELNASCPVTASLAAAYYYVLVDTSLDMQSALPTVRQALSQFGTAQASSGVNFALQLSKAECAGNYAKPVLDFTPLPQAVSMLPQQFTANPQKRVQLDDALLQTVDTLVAITEPASRTLVVFTTGVDQGCNTITDLMHQALSNGLNNGISVRPIQVTGTADQVNLASGLVTQGSAQPVQIAPNNLQTMLSSLNAFRDAVVPCTYVAPNASLYSVQLVATDSGQNSFLTQVAASAQCGASSSYYKSGSTFTLCPTACTNKGTREVITDACETSAPAGAGGASATGSAGASSATAGAAGVNDGSCPTASPQSGGLCSTVVGCKYGTTSCLCNGKTWQCSN